MVKHIYAWLFNQQQSRFIALVDNWERLDEVANSAQDSEDAGLLQYAKTLDSLDTKINNIKTSFQQFYMSLINGPIIGAALDFINELLKGFNKLGNWQSILNIAGLISGIKILGSTILGGLSNPLSKVYERYQSHFKQITETAWRSGLEAGRAHAQGFQAGQNEILNNTPNSGMPNSSLPTAPATTLATKGSLKANKWGTFKNGLSKGSVASIAGSIAGILGSTIGASLSSNGNHQAGAFVSTLGNIASGAATGAAFGPWGALIGGVLGLASSIPALTKAVNGNTARAEATEKAKEEAEKKNIERAETKEDYRQLKDLIAKVEETEKNKFVDNASYQEWINANNELVEAYPELLSYMDSEGNAIADLTNKTQLLDSAMNKAAEASLSYYKARKAELNAQLAEASQYQITHNFGEWSPIGKGTLKDSDGGTQFAKMLLKAGYTVDQIYTKGLNTFNTEDIFKILEANDYDLQDLKYAAGFVYNDKGERVSEEKNTYFWGNTNQQQHTREGTINWDSEQGEGGQWAAEHNDLVKFATILADWGQFFTTDSQGNINFNQQILDYSKISSILSELSGEDKKGAYTNLSLLEDSENLDGHTELLYFYANSIKGHSDEVIAQLTKHSSEWENIVEGYNSFALAFGGLDSSGLEELKTIVANLKDYSWDEINTFLNNNNIVAGTEKYIEIQNAWRSSTGIQRGRLATSLLENRPEFQYNKSGKEDTQEAREEFANTLNATLENEENRIGQFIAQGNLTTIENYSKITSELKKQSEKSSGEQKVALDSQLFSLTQLIDIFGEDKQFTYIEQIFIDKALELLGQEGGAEQLRELAKEYNLIISDTLNDWLISYQNNVWESFDTYVAMAGSKIDTLVSEMDEVYAANEKGLTMEQADKYFSKYGKEATWGEFFTTDQGKLQITNIDEVFITAADGLKNIIDGYNSAVEGIKEEINENNFDTFVLQDQNNIESLLKDTYKFSSEQAASIANYLKNTTNVTYNEFIAFMEKQGAILSDAYSLYNNYINKQKSATIVDNLFKQIELFDKNFNTLEPIKTGDGLYNQDELTNFIWSAQQQGLSIDQDKLLAAAKIDPITNEIYFTAYDFITGTNQAVVDAFVNSLKQGSVNKKIADITKTESAVSALEEGITSIYENIINGKVLFEDIEALFTNAGKTLTNEDIDKIKLLQLAVSSNSTEAAIEIFQQILQTVGADIPVDIEGIRAAQEDVVRVAISSIINSISDGAEGTLSSTDLNVALNKLNINSNEFNKYITAGIDGIKVSSEGILTLATKAVETYGYLPGLANKISEIFENDPALDSYDKINQKIEELETEQSKVIENDENRAAELRQQIQLLTQIRDLQKINPDDEKFKFMEDDPYEGAIDNWDSFTASIKSGMDLITNAFKTGSTTSVREFEKLLHFIAPEGDMGRTIQGTEVTFRQFADALKASMDVTGQVDLSAVASKLNIGMEDIAGAFDTGIEAVAQGQIDYWKTFLKFLLTLKKAETGLGDINLGTIGFKGSAPTKVEVGGTVTYEYKDENGNSVPCKTLEEAQRGYKESIIRQFVKYQDNTHTQQETTELLKQWGINIQFGKDGTFTILPPEGGTEEQLQTAIDNFVAALESGESLPATWSADYTGNTLVQILLKSVGYKFVTDKDGNTTVVKDDGSSEPTAEDLVGDTDVDITALLEQMKFTRDSEDPNVWVYNEDDYELRVEVNPEQGSFKILPPAGGYKAATTDENGAESAAQDADAAAKEALKDAKFKETSDNVWTYTKDDITLTAIIDPTTGTVTINGTRLNADGASTALPDTEVQTALNDIADTPFVWAVSGGTVTATRKDATCAYVFSGAGTIKISPTFNTTASEFQARVNLLTTLLQSGWRVNGGVLTKEYTIGNKPCSVTYSISDNKLIFSTPEVDSSNLDLSTLEGLPEGLTYDSNTKQFKYGDYSIGWSVTSKPITPETPTIDDSNINETAIQDVLSGWTKKEGVDGIYTKTLEGYIIEWDVKSGQISVFNGSDEVPVEAGSALEKTLNTLKTWSGAASTDTETFTKTIDGKTVSWNIASGDILVTGEGKVDEASAKTAIAAAFGDTESTGDWNYTYTGQEVKVSVNASSISIENGNGNLSDSLSFAGAVTLTANTQPVIDAINALDGAHTIAVNVDFNPTTPSGKGETPTKSKNPNEHGINSQVSDVYNALQSNDPITAKEALANLTNTLGDLGEATLTPEELTNLQELFTLLSNDYIGDDVSGLDGTFVNFASALSQISGIFTTNASWSTQLNSLLAALSSGALAVTLPALSSFFTTISSSDLTKLSLDEMIIQLEKLNELSIDTELILSIASAISTLGAAWATLPTTDTNLTVSAKDNATGVIRRIQGALDSLKDKVVKIDVENDEKPLTIKVSFIPKIEQKWTGNVNDLGSALADGNVTKLLAGASFANKTLVGELGPELAVYNGRYHLLGQNGAEFANLPSNAIVFNHKQTEGIVKGQTHIRGTALAEGNVSGPAAASGIDGAIAAVQDIIAMWQGILNASAQQLANGGGGGGGGGTAQAPTAELQEWYNLSREIARIEQEINNLLAERKNLTNGSEYVRNLRKQQLYLDQQLATQQQLYDYQKKQLDRQKLEINSDKVWSQFLIVDENGNLRYRNGNESDGGKGALDVLADLNKKSLKEQVDTIKNTYGYKAYDNTGKDITKDLSNEELVQHFFDSLQAQIDSYDALYDTVQATDQAMAELEAQIAEIEAEILQNTMDLEQAIYDIIVENAEKAIEKLEEYTEKLGEANKAYIDGLKESLDAEKKQYEKEQSDNELSQLQRRLNLLRRTSGSATEIAELEKQLNDSLKEQYFDEQETLIEELEKTSEEQIEKLEQQITIQQEALEFQKEVGLIWNEVAGIMTGTKDQITAWMQSNDSSLRGLSANQLNEALQNTTFQVEMYTTDRDETQQYKKDMQVQEEAGWDSSSSDSIIGQALQNSDQAQYKKNLYDMADEDTQKSMRSAYEQAYLAARQEGKTDEEAHLAGLQAFEAYMTDYYNTNSKGKKHWGAFLKDHLGKDLNIEIGPDGSMVNFFATHEEDLEKANAKIFQELKEKKYNDKSLTGITNYKQLVEHIKFLEKGTEEYKVANRLKKAYEKSELKKSQKKMKQLHGRKAKLDDGTEVGYYSKGGLVDYTGPAIVHGTPSKPEAFLNAKQTAMISDAVRAAGEGNVLDGIRATLASLDSSIRSLVTNNITTQSSNITVAPGAVVLNVAKLNDSYDIEELSNDIMNRMVNIASKATNRGVNRR